MIALGFNGVIVVVQVVFGIIAGSLGLIADAGHNLTDVAAIGASLVAVRTEPLLVQSSRPVAACTGWTHWCLWPLGC